MRAQLNQLNQLNQIDVNSFLVPRSLLNSIGSTGTNDSIGSIGAKLG